MPDSDGLTSRHYWHMPKAHEKQIREKRLSIFCRLIVPEIQLARRDCAPLSNMTHVNYVVAIAFAMFISVC